jgi:Flp pilus assembly protein TadG
MGRPTTNPSTRRRDRGQALMEFAVAIPVFLVMTLGVVDFGRVIWATTSLNEAARVGARFAVVHGGTTTDSCPVGPAGINSNKTPDVSCVYPSPSKQYIYDATKAAAIAGGSNITVTACYGTGCSGNTDAAGADNSRGTLVTVAVSSQISLITPSLLGMTSFTVSANSTMAVNH